MDCPFTRHSRCAAYEMTQNALTCVSRFNFLVCRARISICKRHLSCWATLGNRLLIREETMATSTDALKSPEIEFFPPPKAEYFNCFEIPLVFFFCTWCLCSSLKLVLAKIKWKFCDVFLNLIKFTALWGDCLNGAAKFWHFIFTLTLCSYNFSYFWAAKPEATFLKTRINFSAFHGSRITLT